MPRLAPDDSRPPYRQIAADLRRRVVAGEWSDHERLPSYRSLAASYAVAEGTVKRALAVLRTDGLVITRQGSGSYVRSGGEGAPDPEAESVDDVRVQVRDLAQRVSLIERQLRDL